MDNKQVIELVDHRILSSLGVTGLKQLITYLIFSQDLPSQNLFQVKPNYFICQMPRIFLSDLADDPMASPSSTMKSYFLKGQLNYCLWI